MGRAEKINMLKELHGEDGFEEIENSHHIRIQGERAYVTDPARKLSLRHELAADLAATGMKPSKIARLLKTNGHKSDGGYYATLLRDPRIRERVKSSDVQEVVDKAKETLKNSVAKAAENIADAVQQGDTDLSKYVLATHGVTDKQAQAKADIHMDFGSWLSQVSNTKTMHEIPDAEVISDSTALPETTSERLTK